MALIKCPGCGREISSFAESCNYCGHPISAERQNHSTAGYGDTNQSQTGGKKSGRGKFVAIAIVIVLVVLSFIGRSEQARLQQKAAHESIDIDVPDFEDVFIPKESTD